MRKSQGGIYVLARLRTQLRLLLTLAIAAPLLLPVAAQASATVLPDVPARAGCTPAQADDCASGVAGAETVQYRFFGRADRWLTDPMIIITAPDGIVIDPASVRMQHSVTGATVTPGCRAPVPNSGSRYEIDCVPPPTHFTYGSGEGIRVSFPSTASATYSGNAVVRVVIGDANFSGYLDETTPWIVQLQSDLSVALTGSGSTTAPTDFAYSATVANAGPDGTTATRVTFDLPHEAGIVSSTVDGVGVTCTPVASADASRQPIVCPAGPIASGGSRTVTVTAHYALGERGLASLPATRTTTVSAAPGVGVEAADPMGANSSASLAVTLQPAATNPCSVSGGSDVLSGCPFGAPIYGDAGDDTFTAGVGVDIFSGGSGNDVFDGGAGNDTFYGGTGADAGFGGLGDDFLVGGLGSDRLVGGVDADRVYGNGGADALYGSTGNDFVAGGGGNDHVHGGTGADTITCGPGIDVATGDDGNDLIGCHDGAPGDAISGGRGRDTCFGDRGDHFFACERVVRS